MSEPALPTGVALTAIDETFKEDPYPVLSRIREAARVLHDEELGVRTLAARALFLLPEEKSMASLREVFETTEDVPVKVNSMFGLARYGDKDAIREAIAFCKDESKRRPSRRLGSKRLKTRSKRSKRRFTKHAIS